jgi:hypothetical protein
MVKFCTFRYRTESTINLGCASTCTLCGPLDDMILENPFMKLVKKFGSEAQEDVAMRQPFPETLAIKFVHASSMSGIGHYIQDFVMAAKTSYFTITFQSAYPKASAILILNLHHPIWICLLFPY